MSKVLLHICCGVCALEAIERLKSENFAVEGVFFNPNIYPDKEYRKRKAAAKKAAYLKGVNLIGADYNPSAWLDVCARYPDDKEGQRRCRCCWQMRLEQVFEICLKNKFDYFTTTLTISPHKNSAALIAIGKSIDADRFLAIDFKKKDGFKKTIELAKKYKLYRQNYCGCIYSRN